ncbi:uncharacterized protein LOC123290806 [Chrysoperla carnea]|uniref:uncharacterized protein LOC123290806 n=1 Tax=Chrysoperla carnea TaxID=189513 RepID=UPI001D0844FD|nr:uncharacterized protein LOC123290806 [Chrysoperla carnea]
MYKNLILNTQVLVASSTKTSPSSSSSKSTPHKRNNYKMVKCKTGLWIFIMLLFSIGYCSGNVRVELKMPRYVEKGQSATLHCVHSADPQMVYKVEWRKNGNKIFQYIKERNPPYVNYTITGAKLDWENSNDKQIKLTGLDFTASGPYTCIVSLETPLIFTKESQHQELEVILPQTSDPKITFEKEVYNVGETLVANCTTSVARPPPHITWLINDQKVNEALVKSFTNVHRNGVRNGLRVVTATNEHIRGGHSHHHHIDASVSQLSVEVSELHAGDSGKLELTCVATIPGYLGHGEKYADIRTHTVTIDVAMIDVISSSEMSNTASNSTGSMIKSSTVLTTSMVLMLKIYLGFKIK